MADPPALQRVSAYSSIPRPLQSQSQRGAQLSKQNRVYQYQLPESRIPILEYSDDDPDDKYRKAKSGCCRNTETNTVLLFGVLFMLTILAVIGIVLVVSAYGPAGQVKTMINTASTMVQQVNNSGLTNVVANIVYNWQAGNHTDQTFTLLDALYHSGAQVADIVLAIEPEMVRQLTNQTSITINQLLTLAENIITNKGINIQIPLHR